MKKLLLLASAVSALALATGANADQTASWTLALTGTSSPSISITGQVAGSCTIGTCTDNGSSNSRAINLTNFTTAAGKTNHFIGSTSITVSSNAVYTATLTSDNSGLKNGGDTIHYNIQLDDKSSADAGTAQSKLYPATVAGSDKSIPVAFEIPADSTAANTGQYSDTLHLTVTVQ
jgi:spore coat protein U-like protein